MSKRTSPLLNDYLGVPVERRLKRNLQKIAGPSRGAMTDRARRYIREGVERDLQQAVAPQQPATLTA